MGCAWPANSSALTQSSVFWTILPYIEQSSLYNSLAAAGQTSSAYFNGSGLSATVPIYICPSDYSGIGNNGTGAGWNLASYAVNGQVFFGQYPTLARSFSDGTSNTVLFVEHMALCRNPLGGNNATDGRMVWPAVNLTTGDPIVYWTGETTTTNFPGFPGFAIQYPTAMVPDPNNNNVLSWMLPQAAPTMNANGTCSPLTASAGHPSGVNVGMGDGSVHLAPPTVSLATWNAVLTPSGGELVGADW